MLRLLVSAWVLIGPSSTIGLWAALPDGVDPSDRLAQLGVLDVTQPPYAADPTGEADSTAAIQRAVDDARDHGMACFFPEGVYRISDTISCEQKVEKLDRPRATDGKTQHYWDLPHRIVMIGSTKGRRPILKLSPDAKGFDDPDNPKLAVWVWAQTRDDAPGKQEPAWGVEQPNISFSHIFKGIDIDIRGHAGAIGIRHSGSQGSTLQDVTVLAEGAYAGLSNCCGQGGGTYNVEVIGGKFGITIDRSSRFPLLAACRFVGQTDVSVRFVEPNQMPTLMVGCAIQCNGDAAIDLSRSTGNAGISLIDCTVELRDGGSLCRTRSGENIFLEDVWLRRVSRIETAGEQGWSDDSWRKVLRSSNAVGSAVQMVNGVTSTSRLLEVEEAESAPTADSLRDRHHARLPSFEDEGVVNVRVHGAKGDGESDDTAAFEAAIAAGNEVFVPPGNYHLTRSLPLGPKTQLFGLGAGITSIGDQQASQRSARVADTNTFHIDTEDDPTASPLLAFLSVRGEVRWNSGRATCMLAPARLKFSANGGGRIYGAMARGGPMVFRGLRQPLSFYALNVERVNENPQSIFDDCQNVRIYFFKVEAGTTNRPGNLDANTPCRIVNSANIRVYCMYGNVRRLGDRAMMEVIDSNHIQISQLKSFQSEGFPQLMERRGDSAYEIDSRTSCALFLREASE